MNIFFLFLFVLLPTLNYAGTVYIVPSYLGLTDESSFSTDGRDGCNLPMIALRNAIIKKGHKFTFLTTNNIHALDKDCWFFGLDVPLDQAIIKVINNHSKKRSILIIGEPPSVAPQNYQPRLHKHFKKAFTYFDELIDNKHYFKFYYPQPFLYMIDDIVPFEQKKLCTMIVGEHYSSHPDELYTARRNIISFFERMHPLDFDFYGWGWNAHNHPCYKGTVAHKLPYLKNYKFAICYENMRSISYMTEKIFDVMHAGCVPIYCGPREIAKYIPQRAYILRDDFASDEELYNYLSSMTEDEYNTYLRAAQEFYNSPAAKNFSIDHFVTTIINALFDK